MKLFLITIECPTESDINLCTADRRIHYRAIEIVRERVCRIHYRVLLFEISHIFGAKINAPCAKIFGYLCHKLWIPPETFVPQGIHGIGLRQPSATIELSRYIELPFFQRRLIRSRNQTFKTICKGLFTQHPANGLFYVASSSTLV